MKFRNALRIAERNLANGATLDELKDTVQNLRALAPASALADLVEARIAALEGQCHRERSERSAD